MLKMSLNEIRGKIQMYPENWINMHTTNCYAYALGLDVRQSDICDYAYQPGTISDVANISKLEYFPYDMLIKGIESDLEFLKIAYRSIEEGEMLTLSEWKIALLVDGYDDYLIDFHFLRQNSNGIWLHKDGYQGIIGKKDKNSNNILNPSNAELYPYVYKKCYALRLEK